MKVTKMRLIEYGNKTRKGIYVSVRVEGQKRDKLYKYDSKKPLDYYSYLAENNLKQTKNGQEKKYKEWEIKRLKGRTEMKVTDAMKQGMTRVRVGLTELATLNGQKKVLRELFSPLVWDKDLLEIVIQNRHKLRNRFAYDLEIMGHRKEGEEQVLLGRVRDIGNRTPEETWAVYGGELKYLKGKVLGMGEIESNAMKYRLPSGAAKQYSSTGIIDGTIVTITFQRG